MNFREHLLGILEGFEDTDGIIRDVKTQDILTALCDDLDPVWCRAQELLAALKPFAELLEETEEQESAEFQAFVSVQDVAYAQQIVSEAEGEAEASDQI